MDVLKIDAAALASDAAWIAKGKAPRYNHGTAVVLNSVHVSVTGAGLRLRRTDYELFREAVTPADSAVGGDSAVLVDPVQLAKLTKGAKGDALVSVSPSGLEIVNGARTVTLPPAVGDIADYPQWPDFVASQIDPAASIDPAKVKAALTSAGKNATLPMLTGVRFDDGEMATTDRFRLTRVRYAADGFCALVPASALSPFTVGKGGPISVEYGILASMPNPGAGEARVRVSRDNRSIVVREMDNEFPKWRRLIDAAASGATLFAEVRKVDLVSALAGVHVDLTFQPGGTVTVDSRRSVADDVLMSQVVAADIASDDGLPVTVRMSTEYLGAALKAIPADVVTVQMATPTRPVLLSGGGDTHLVMPQRIPS